MSLELLALSCELLLRLAMGLFRLVSARDDQVGGSCVVDFATDEPLVGGGFSRFGSIQLARSGCCCSFLLLLAPFKI